MTLYHFSHNHASVENYPKWKGPTTISDIPFVTEPWLWEEGYFLNQNHRIWNLPTNLLLIRSFTVVTWSLNL